MKSTRKKIQGLVRKTRKLRYADAKNKRNSYIVRTFLELLNNSIIVSKCFFSLTVFFTLLLSFQKSSLAIMEFKLSSFDLILLVSKIPPNITQCFFSYNYLMIYYFH